MANLFFRNCLLRNISFRNISDRMLMIFMIYQCSKAVGQAISFSEQAFSLFCPHLPAIALAFLFQEDGVRDVVEEGVLPLSSQEAETMQDWLFLSSSQLDHLESPEDECELAEQKLKEHSEVESGEREQCLCKHLLGYSS